MVTGVGGDDPVKSALYTRSMCSGDLTGGPPSMSVTVYSKHVHMRFNIYKTVSALQALGA